jgi:hypothetical protein
MSFQLDAQFFRKAKKVNRAVEITETQAYIPAVRDSPEIRVALPNRRLKTMEERTNELTARYEAIDALEEEIERERKSLLAVTATYRELGSGAADVVVQNQKVRDLMERRKKLAYPQIWIEDLGALGRNEIFESKRDTRKLDNKHVFQIKRRLEPVESLYVDAGKPEAEILEVAPESGGAVGAAIAPSAVPKTAEEIAADEKRGAIVQQTKKKTFKLAKPAASGAAGAAGSILGGLI